MWIGFKSFLITETRRESEQRSVSFSLLTACSIKFFFLSTKTTCSILGFAAFPTLQKPLHRSSETSRPQIHFFHNVKNVVAGDEVLFWNTELSKVEKSDLLMLQTDGNHYTLIIFNYGFRAFYLRSYKEDVVHVVYTCVLLCPPRCIWRPSVNSLIFGLCLNLKCWVDTSLKRLGCSCDTADLWIWTIYLQPHWHFLLHEFAEVNSWNYNKLSVVSDLRWTSFRCINESSFIAGY